jgi:hypothetical protein
MDSGPDIYYGAGAHLRTFSDPWLTITQIVDEASAVLPGLHYVVLDSDHLKLNKFAGKQDGNYLSVSSNLTRIAAQAPQLIQNRRKGRSRTLPHVRQTGC